MRVPKRVETFWSGSPLVFAIPRVASWLFQATSEYRFGGHEEGRFVNGVWRADLYSNGVAEAENPVRLAEVKRQLLKNVNHAIEKGGYNRKDVLALAA
jgi:hypothetical protein